MLVFELIFLIWDEPVFQPFSEGLGAMSGEKSGEKMPAEVEKRPKSLDIRANDRFGLKSIFFVQPCSICLFEAVIMDVCPIEGSQPRKGVRPGAERRLSSFAIKGA